VFNFGRIFIFLDSEGDLQEKPVINGKLETNDRTNGGKNQSKKTENRGKTVSIK
tara:strand:+ start:97 stop:258 length:162 start_codon:yes stop_codon:yes gene_type:complete